MFFATCSYSRVSEPCEMLDHRGGVRCTGDAQRSGEGVPSGRHREATVIGMQPGTPARTTTCGVHRDGHVTVPRRHRHHPEQFDSQLSLPATDAHAHRSGACLRGRTFALDHGSVYRHHRAVQNHVPRTTPGRLPRSHRARCWPLRRRCGCRSASRSGGLRAGRSALPCRSPATVGSRARSPGRRGSRRRRR